MVTVKGKRLPCVFGTRGEVQKALATNPTLRVHDIHGNLFKFDPVDDIVIWDDVERIPDFYPAVMAPEDGAWIEVLNDTKS